MHYMNKTFPSLNDKDRGREKFLMKKSDVHRKDERRLKKIFWKYFKKNFAKKKEQHSSFDERRSGLSIELRPSEGFSSERQIVDQRLTLNESQRKTALTITTPRSSTRSFANDLAPRLSTRELTLTQGDACRTHEGTRLRGFFRTLTYRRSVSVLNASNEQKMHVSLVSLSLL